MSTKKLVPKDLLLTSAKPRKSTVKNILVALILIACILSDAICTFTFSENMFNEYEYISIFVSIIIAICLDCTTWWAGVCVGTCSRNQKVAKKKRRTAIFMWIGFLLGWIALLLLALAATSNSIRLADWARLLLPIATSILSYFIGMKFDPDGERLSEIQLEITNLQVCIAESKAEANRLKQCFENFDPALYDAQNLKIAQKRLNAILMEEKYKIHMLLAQELGSETAANTFLKEIISDTPENPILGKIEDFDPNISPCKRNSSGQYPEDESVSEASNQDISNQL